MADSIKRKFRGAEGFDAAGEKIVNVATADRTVLSDGVNVEFLIQENTLQQYDETRGYTSGFAVIYDNRIWVSNRDIAKPAGAFNELFWNSVRTDAKWRVVSSGTTTLKSGEFISVDTNKGNDMVFTLPSNPQDGDTIMLKDIGNKTGTVGVVINASVQDIVLRDPANKVRSVRMTHPLSQYVFVFSNRLWNLYVSDYARYARIVTPSAVVQAQSNDFIVRRYTSPGPIRVTLPKFANTGDIINFTDLDGKNPQFHMIVSTFDDNTNIGTVGQKSVEVRTSGDGFIVYDASESIWRIWEGDLRPRMRVITDNVTLIPNDVVTVFGVNNSTQKTIDITLPTDIAVGDTVTIAMNYMRKGQKVNIIAATGDKIASSLQLLQFPKRSEYPPDAAWVMNDSLTFDGTTSYVPVLQLSYIENAGSKYWIVADNAPTVERVDSKDNETRKRLGVIALASQTQANVDYENNPEKELAITPETLANRIATKIRRGIARLVTLTEIQAPTTGPHLDDVIVTPAMLNEKTATEERRGVAETATQAETNGSTDDERIVTPKKLHNRIASETLTGILKLVRTVGTAAGIGRDTKGTNIYDYDNNIDAVTPKSLFQFKSTEQAQGGVYLATQNEVIAGGPAQPGFPVVVTPQTLHGKTSTDSRIGLIQIAKQAEVDAGTDYTKAVTPKTLNDRKAREDLSGIAEIATQTEFDSGTDDTRIVTPLKVKTRFNSTDRTSVVALSGLVEQGTLWDHYTLDIKEASETQRGTAALATQVQVDAGTDDKTIVTPKKLQAKKATETTEGIIQVANQTETVAGTIATKAVSPKNLKYIAQDEKTWESTVARRGFVKLSEKALTFKGDATNGSGRLLPGDLINEPALTDLPKDGYAVSPYEMNRALQYFLPAKAKAVDSDLLDGIDSTQFVRRDIDQVVNGKITFKKDVTLEAPLVSSSTAKFTTVNATISVDIGDTLGNSRINLNTLENGWNIETLANGSTLDFTAADKVLTLNRNGNVTVAQTLTAMNKVDASKGFSVEGGTMVINPSSSEIVIGTQSKQVTLQNKDAKTFSVVDPSGTYTILNTKNAFEITAQGFVKKAGDSMTGQLQISAPLTVQIPEGKVQPDVKPSDENPASWSASITSAIVYNKLPGFGVPVMEKNDQGQDTGFVDHYEYVKGPGVLSQHGIGKTAVYQIWAPRPDAAALNHNAQTFWIRNFNIVTNDWDEWGKMYTSVQRPTAGEIGAVSTSGSAFNNLTIRDWLQIKNVRIVPNETTRTVDFIWVDE